MSKNIALLALLASLSLAAPIVEKRDPLLGLDLGLDAGLDLDLGDALDLDLDASLDLDLDIPDLTIPSPTAVPTGRVTTFPTNPTGGNVPSVDLSLSVDFDLNVAIALQNAISGVPSIAVDINIRIALAVYLRGAGAQRFDPSVTQAIITWCYSTGAYVVPHEIRSIFIDIQVSAISDVSVSSAGGYIPYLNHYIEQSHQQACSCSALDEPSRHSLYVWLQSSAAISLDISILASLQVAVTGGVAASLDVTARTSLQTWLSSNHCPLDHEIIVICQGWLEHGTGVTVPPTPTYPSSPTYPVSVPTHPTYPTIPTYPTYPTHSNVPTYSAGAPIINVDTHIIIDVETQITLIAWINAQVNLDISVRTALQACAYGGPSIAIDPYLRSSLSAYLSSPYCTLSADLVIVIQLWLSAQTGPSVITAPAPTLSYTNTAVSVYTNVQVSGSLSVDYQTQLGNWCSTNGNNIPTPVYTGLQYCSQGKIATEIDISILIALQAFLSSPSCPIEPTLRASIIVWLSIAIDISGTTSTPTGTIPPVVITNPSPITAILNADIALSATVRAALGVAVAGDSAGVLDLSVRAELAAFLTSSSATTLPAVSDVGSELLGWLSGVSL